MDSITLRPSPASWRGRGSPRFVGRDDVAPLWPVFGLAAAAIAAAAGLAVWMLAGWPMA
jgi:hypothetical protein